MKKRKSPAAVVSERKLIKIKQHDFFPCWKCVIMCCCILLSASEWRNKENHSSSIDPWQSIENNLIPIMVTENYLLSMKRKKNNKYLVCSNNKRKKWKINSLMFLKRQFNEFRFSFYCFGSTVVSCRKSNNHYVLWLSHSFRALFFMYINV